jgi:hypothetical protein
MEVPVPPALAKRALAATTNPPADCVKELDAKLVTLGAVLLAPTEGVVDTKRASSTE